MKQIRLVHYCKLQFVIHKTVINIFVNAPFPLLLKTLMMSLSSFGVGFLDLYYATLVEGVIVLLCVEGQGQNDCLLS